MEGPPRINIRDCASNLSDNDWIVELPVSDEEWLHNTEGYAGRDISWFMVQSDDFMKHVPKHLIDPYYERPEAKLLFQHLVSIASSSEYLNLVCNACHYIRAPEHQQWLMTVMNDKNEASAEFMILDLRHNPEDQELKQLREAIWKLIK